MREIWMMEGSDPASILREIEQLARAAHVPARLVTQRQIREVQGTESPQGVVAFASPLEEVELEALVATSPGRPFLVVVDGVTDPQNLGALLRAAECAGVTGVVLPRHRSALIGPTVTKVAAGAVEYLPISVVPGIPGALQTLTRLGVWLVGMDERARSTLYEQALGDRPIALVLGAEDRGLSPLTRDRCDALCKIPQLGSTSSLNVAAAAAVAMFEVVRQHEIEGARR